MNGKKVKPHLYPWMVAQYLETSKGYQLNCGGAIISDKNILTAGLIQNFNIDHELNLNNFFTFSSLRFPVCILNLYIF